MKISEKYIFLVGTPRSGATVINQSFDGHPEVLAWPWEFFYFEWFYEIANGRNSVSCYELNNNLKTFFIDNFTKTLIETEKYKNKKSITPEDLNFGSFDYNNFNNLINEKNSKKFTSTEYLNFLFKCLKDSDSRYINKEIKYFLIHVTARGFDWSNETLIKSSHLFFNYRDINEIYSSLKKKYDKGNLYYLNLFSLKYKKSTLYWFETFRQIDRLTNKYLDKKNFHIINLKLLQQNTRSCLGEICDKIQVDLHSSIHTLTVFGMKTFGHVNANNPTAGKIVLQKNYQLMMFSFEKKLLKSLSLFDYLKGRKMKPYNYAFSAMLYDAFKVAFFEIPKNRVSKKSKRSLLYNFKGRATILINLIRTYIILTNEEKSLRILMRKNKLVSETSIFWKKN